MHEMAICCALMDMVTAEVHRRNAGHVCEIRMSIGGLTCLEPRVLVSAFEIASENSELEGATLTVTRHPVRLYCEDCGGERTADRHFRCSCCQGTNVRLLPGQGMTLDEIVCQ